MRTLAKIIALSVLAAGCSIPLEALAGNTPKTPIHHLIIIVGENHSFDNLFATYQPSHGQQVANLLSKGIVDLNGAPGPNASQARQWQALRRNDTQSRSLARVPSRSCRSRTLLSIANYVIAQPDLFATSAIMATFDEGGGYYDSGYIQTLDFFGDGTRIPLFVISPYVVAGSIDHTYSDHASILKFIEANWNLRPMSPRSRDNLPNPVVAAARPYVPTNGPALGDLMSIFDFAHRQPAPALIIPGGI